MAKSYVFANDLVHIGFAADGFLPDHIFNAEINPRGVKRSH